MPACLSHHFESSQVNLMCVSALCECVCFGSVSSAAAAPKVYAFIIKLATQFVSPEQYTREADGKKRHSKTRTNERHIKNVTLGGAKFDKSYLYSNAPARTHARHASMRMCAHTHFAWIVKHQPNLYAPPTTIHIAFRFHRILLAKVRFVGGQYNYNNVQRIVRWKS